MVHDPSALALLIKKVGFDRIMLGSDMPFPIGDPMPRILDHIQLTTTERSMLETNVAKALFDL